MSDLGEAIKLLRMPDDREKRLAIEGFLARMDEVVVKVCQDESPSNPRVDWDNVGVMFCKHSRYDLGDKDAEDPFVTDDDGDRDLRDDIAVCLPIYMYNHSGLTVSTKPFNCPWDSGQLGVIYATQETVDREWGGDIEKAKTYLKGEVEAYDHYLTGEVYGYTIETKAGDVIHSCWGFYGDTLEETGMLCNVDPKYRDALRKAWEKM